MKSIRNLISGIAGSTLAMLCIAHAQSQPAWTRVSIPGLAKNSTLTQLWAQNRSLAFVWARSADPQGNVIEGVLYRWNGTEWRPTLRVPGQSPSSVFAVDTQLVWAAAANHLYRSTDGGSHWEEVSLPEEVSLDPANYVDSLTGTPNNLHLRFARSDGNYAILRYDGAAWSTVHELTNRKNTPYFLQVTSPNEGYFVGCWGRGYWDGTTWNDELQPTSLCDAYGMWVGHDADGKSRVYATGNNNFSNGVRVWLWNDEGAAFDQIFSAGSGFNIGSGKMIWGASTDNIYVVGGIASTSGGTRSGRIYHYDGNDWSEVAGVGEIPNTQWVHGTASDDVWVALVDGSLLHYAPPIEASPAIGIALYAGLTLNGSLGKSYRIEFRSSEDAPWATLKTLTVESNPVLIFDDQQPASSGKRFYRAVQLP